MKNQKLLDALKTIKKECNKHSDCEGCIFFNNKPGNWNACKLDTTPFQWHPWDWITGNDDTDDNDFGRY